MAPTITDAAPAPATVRSDGDMDYHALNAMLNLYGPNGEIQFEKDREAANQYFLQHVNQNTVFFHDLKERLEYLVQNEYYEQSVLDQYVRSTRPGGQFSFRFGAKLLTKFTYFTGL